MGRLVGIATILGPASQPRPPGAGTRLSGPGTLAVCVIVAYCSRCSPLHSTLTRHTTLCNPGRASLKNLRLLWFSEALVRLYSLNGGIPVVYRGSIASWRRAFAPRAMDGRTVHARPPALRALPLAHPAEHVGSLSVHSQAPRLRADHACSCSSDVERLTSQ